MSSVLSLQSVADMLSTAVDLSEIRREKLLILDDVDSDEILNSSDDIIDEQISINDDGIPGIDCTFDDDIYSDTDSDSDSDVSAQIDIEHVAGVVDEIENDVGGCCDSDDSSECESDDDLNSVDMESDTDVDCFQEIDCMPDTCSNLVDKCVIGNTEFEYFPDKVGGYLQVFKL